MALTQLEILMLFWLVFHAKHFLSLDIAKALLTIMAEENYFLKSWTLFELKIQKLFF